MQINHKINLAPSWCVKLLILISFFFISCGEEKSNSDAWTSILNPIPHSKISRIGQIKIQFNQDLIEPSLIGSDFKGELNFEPTIEGVATWVSTDQILFKSDKPLKALTQYQGILSSKNIPNLSSNTPDFRFSFEITEQSFKVQWGSFTPTFDTTANWQNMSGTLSTSDFADSLNVEKIIQVKQYDKNLNLEWQHQGLEHQFVIKEIKRSKKVEQIEIQLDGSVIGVENAQKSELLKIPSTLDFFALSANAINSNPQYIDVLFSDPIDQKQNLEGLVNLSIDNKVHYEIEGNHLKVYLRERYAGELNISIDKGIKTREGVKLSRAFNKSLKFEISKPALRFANKGNILPNSPNLNIPIEAVSLSGLTVKVFEIFKNNMGQFLQDNTLDGSQALNKVGRYLFEKNIVLPMDSSANSDWNLYNLDLKDLLKEKSGSMLRLELSFDQSQITYPCKTNEGDSTLEINEKKPLKNWDFNESQDPSSWDNWSENNYDYYSFNWSNLENPCTKEFYNTSYNDKIVKKQNFLASDFGIIAKMGNDKRLHVSTSYLSTGEALSGANIEVLNFQNQVLKKGIADQNGQIIFDLKSDPFWLKVQKDSQFGYLKLNPATALTNSHFDIGGQNAQSGLKALIYGERGVWRPGDSLFLTLVVVDKNKTLPKDHPISFSLKNPSGQITFKEIKKEGLNGFYSFKIPTSPDISTGTYFAQAEIGGFKTSKAIKIETVIPNRLKIELNFDGDTLSAKDENISFEIFSQYLHGAKADQLRSEVEISYQPLKAEFKTFSDYTFNDPTRSFYSESNSIFEGYLNAEGKVRVNTDLSLPSPPSGFLNLDFTTRVFEKSGGFSITRHQMPYLPYQTFVGIKTPKGDVARGMLLTDTTHTVDIAVIDANGKPKNNKVRFRFLKMDWKWWWDKSQDDLGRYAADQNQTSIIDTMITASKGHAKIDFKLRYPEWGRYLVQACDSEASEQNFNHCSSKIIYIDWPGWAGKARENSGGIGATMLSLSTDKNKYNVGEKVQLQIPSPTKARALLSLENSQKVIQSYWVELNPGSNQVEFDLNEDMAPNLYAHVTLVQSHLDKKNDKPIRLYGIVPIYVENPETHLNPKIISQEQTRPNSTLEIKIKEENQKAMTYTLAVVDEGLLGLTQFQTPKLWNYFYQKEALGVSTWDLFDFVVGAYGAKLEKLIAIGGDESGANANQNNTNRFKPLVRFYGPFTLEAKEERLHKIDIPEYLGAVRAMVVSGQDGAFGFDEKTILVKQPLMIQSLAPRVLGPNESFTLPVTVFTLDKKVTNVKVKVLSDKLISSDKESSKSLNFKDTGEKIVLFNFKTPNSLGPIKIKVEANGSGESVKEEIEILVRSPNPIERQDHLFELKANRDTTFEISPLGYDGTNNNKLLVSTIPDLNLEGPLQKLIAYPHGCVEQTTSKAFPQLFLSSLIQYSDNDLQKIQTHIKHAITKLAKFQAVNGGFNYWQGANEINYWATNYVGHFLLEAKNLGYEVDQKILYSWLSFQKKQASTWWFPNNNEESKVQSYRLYTLALADKADLSAMNRLRENQNLNSENKIILGMAYQLAGQTKVAAELISYNLNPQISNSEADQSFSSLQQSLAIQLEAQRLLKHNDKAQNLAKALISELKKEKFYSTQSTSWSLLSLGRFYQQSSTKDLNFTTQLSSEKSQLNSFKKANAVFNVDLKKSNTPYRVSNTSNQTLYFDLIQSGAPLNNDESQFANGLELKVSYQNLNGESIDVKNLKQGKDFSAIVEVKNNTSQNLPHLALTQIFASGWEILNDRLAEDSQDPYNRPQNIFVHQDIRDDRVLTYLELKPNEQKTFKIKLHAAYLGNFYLPAVRLEDMYKGDINAQIKGYSVNVNP